MTTKTAVEVLVDPAAEANAKAIEADTKAAVERAWCSDHPRVDPKTVHAVKVKDDDGYLIQIDGAAYLCVLLNAREVAIARCRAEDRQLLEAPHKVTIPPVPEPPAPPTLLATVAHLRHQVTEALDLFRRTVHLWATHVDVRRPDPLSDLRAIYPGTTRSPFVDERDRANVDGLTDLARIIEQAAHYARVAPALASDYRHLVQETTAAIQAGRATLVVPVLPSVLTAGEPPVHIARSGAERALDEAEAQTDKLKDALATLEPIIAGLSAATPRFLVAALQTVREGWVAIVKLHIEVEAKKLRALRVIPFERVATQAIGDLAQDVPEIHWPSDLLGDPTT
jgi:hypothetical protein